MNSKTMPEDQSFLTFYEQSIPKVLNEPDCEYKLNPVDIELFAKHPELAYIIRRAEPSDVLNSSQRVEFLGSGLHCVLIAFRPGIQAWQYYAVGRTDRLKGKKKSAWRPVNRAIGLAECLIDKNAHSLGELRHLPKHSISADVEAMT